MTITIDGSNGITPLGVSQNLTFTGTGNRITGDFSNATASNRVLFQTSTTNGFTAIATIPNGTSAQSFIGASNSSDPNNAAFMQIDCGPTGAFVRSNITGTGTYLPMIFQTGGSERMRIDSSGNICVGTTSSPVSGARFRAVAGTGDWSFGPNSGGNAYFVYNASSTGVYISSGATAWTANSDERVKDIIEPITDAANKVSSLRAVIGKYKKDEDGTRRSFLIAQDVQAVLPEAVNVQEDEMGTLGLQYTDVIPLLVAAIQEQQEQIELMKQEIAAMKGAA